jgi:hypothetical protein
VSARWATNLDTKTILILFV